MRPEILKCQAAEERGNMPVTCFSEEGPFKLAALDRYVAGSVGESPLLRKAKRHPVVRDFIRKHDKNAKLVSQTDNNIEFVTFFAIIRFQIRRFKIPDLSTKRDGPRHHCS